MKTEKELVIPIGIQYTSLHHIDHNTGIITAIDIDSQSEALGQYIERLLADIKERNSKRSFVFNSNTTEIRSSITLFMNEAYEKATEINAKRLLKVEQEAQEEMDKLKITIQKGSLFQTIINVDKETKMIIIGKADHNDFLDASDFAIHRGLPWKKRIFKSFLAITDHHNNIIKILVSDTTNALTKYWWHSFLELTEERTDSHNTKKFLEIIDKKVLDRIKDKFPADHTILRNSVIGHFRSQIDFDLDNMFTQIFETYPPIEDDFPIQDIQSRIKEIPEKYNLDSQFQIDKKEINKRAVHKVVLNEGMELLLNGAPDLDNITAFVDKENNKYIAIKSDEGYKRFKK